MSKIRPKSTYSNPSDVWKPEKRRIDGKFSTKNSKETGMESKFARMKMRIS